MSQKVDRNLALKGYLDGSFNLKELSIGESEAGFQQAIDGVDCEVIKSVSGLTDTISAWLSIGPGARPRTRPRFNGMVREFVKPT